MQKSKFNFRKALSLVLGLTLLLSSAACNNSSGLNKEVKVDFQEYLELKPVNIDDKYDTYYEVFVYSFADSNGDGIGDFKGLTDKLDYINDGKDDTMTDLGANAIWLMPINPSPTYHKYDVKDYKAIDPQYGSMEDFDAFMKAAKSRGIKVILDLVMNHSSSEHPWFQEAVSALEKGDLDNKYIDYYFFSKEKKADYWYPVGNTGYYYEGKFWSEMPDLNLDNEELRAEFKDIMEFWLNDKGVNGFRLDAVKEFDSDNNPHNIEILSWINSTARSIKDDVYIVGEAWSNFSMYKQYYESGIDSFFDFAFGDQGGITVSSINKSDGQSYAANLETVNQKILEVNPEAINAPFMSNHDTGRLSGFFSGDPNKLRIAAAANIFTTGNSFVYYGEEIGMRGSGRDENKRAYFYWGDNDKYQTKGAQLDENAYGYPFSSVKEQTADPNSLLNYYKKAIRINSAFPEISRGITTKATGIDNKEICAIQKSWTDSDGKEHNALIIINFSNSDTVELDLASTNYADYKLVARLGDAEGNLPSQDGSKLTITKAGALVLKPAN